MTSCIELLGAASRSLFVSATCTGVGRLLPNFWKNSGRNLSHLNAQQISKMVIYSRVNNISRWLLSLAYLFETSNGANFLPCIAMIGQVSRRIHTLQILQIVAPILSQMPYTKNKPINSQIHAHVFSEICTDQSRLSSSLHTTKTWTCLRRRGTLNLLQVFLHIQGLSQLRN